MSDKQIGDSIRTYNPAPVEFNGFLLGEAVHDEEFIKGIAERACEMRKRLEMRRAHFYGRPLKAVIYEQSLVR